MKLNSLDEFNKMDIDDLLDIKVNNTKIIIDSSFDIQWDESGELLNVPIELKEKILEEIIKLDTLSDLKLSLDNIQSKLKTLNLDSDLDNIKNVIDNYNRFTKKNKVDHIVKKLNLDLTSTIWLIIALNNLK